MRERERKGEREDRERGRESQGRKYTRGYTSEALSRRDVEIS